MRSIMLPFEVIRHSESRLIPLISGGLYTKEWVGGRLLEGVLPKSVI